MKELNEIELNLVTGGRSDEGYDDAHNVGRNLKKLSDSISDAIDDLVEWWNS
jgi:hypothetical protein